MGKEYNIRVGKCASIKIGLFNSVSVTYAGMPTEKTFSLCLSNIWYYNLYFPKSKKEIDLDKGYLKVLDVTPDDILLEYVKDE